MGRKNFSSTDSCNLLMMSNCKKFARRLNRSNLLLMEIMILTYSRLLISIKKQQAIFVISSIIYLSCQSFLNFHFMRKCLQDLWDKKMGENVILTWKTHFESFNVASNACRKSKIKWVWWTGWWKMKWKWRFYTTGCMCIPQGSISFQKRGS